MEDKNSSEALKNKIEIFVKNREENESEISKINFVENSAEASRLLKEVLKYCKGEINEIFLPFKIHELSRIAYFSNSNDFRSYNEHYEKNEKYNTIHYLAGIEDYELLKEFIEKINNVNVKTKTTEKTPLYIAVEKGLVGNVGLLIGKGANVNVVEKTLKDTLLHAAVKNGNSDIINTLIENQLDVNARNTTENTPLHYAAMYAKNGVVSTLIKEGADIFAENDKGETPLHIAIEIKEEKKRNSIVESLISNGVYFDKKELKKLKLSDEILKEYTDCYEKHIKEFLLSNYDGDISGILKDKSDFVPNLPDTINLEKINYKELSKNTYLLFKAAEKSDYSAIAFLLDPAKIDINKQEGETRYTVLHNLIKSKEYKNVTMIKFLIEHGANVNAIDKDGKTPLYYAFKNENNRIVEALLNEKANINIEDNEGNTLLHIAFNKEKGENFAKALLDKGVSVKLTNKDGKTPLHVAAETGFEDIDIVKSLLEVGAYQAINNQDKFGKTALHYALENGNEEIIKALLNEKANINIEDNEGNRPIHIAAKKVKNEEEEKGENNEIIKFLLENGADFDKKNKKGETALHIAIKSENQSFISTLNNLIFIKNNVENDDLKNISNDASDSFIIFQNNEYLQKLATSLLSQDDSGNTPIHLLSANKNLYLCLNYMLSNFYEKFYEEILKIKNKKGETPLHIAIKQGNNETVKFFLDNKVDVNIKDNEGNTPLHLAIENKDTEIIEKILDKDVRPFSVLSVANNKGLIPLHLAVEKEEKKLLNFY